MRPARHRYLLAFASVVLLLAAQGDAQPPPWEIACGDGRVDDVLDDFNDLSGWTVIRPDPSLPAPPPRTEAGCRGPNAMAVDYNVDQVAPPGSPNAGQSWTVAAKTIPATNLTSRTHIRLAMRGSDLNSHHHVEVKLKDQDGSLFAVTLRSMTDLPVWKPIYIDFRELTGSGTLDLANIIGMEVAISKCAADCEVWDNPDLPGPANVSAGTMFFDEFAVVDLKLGGPHRLVQAQFAQVPVDHTLRAATATVMLNEIEPSGPGAGLSPAWYPEVNPNFNIYAQAQTLLVFVYEYERTGNAAFRSAANSLAAILVARQIAPGLNQAGAWFTGYTVQGGMLTPPHRSIPATNPPVCDGNESMVDGHAGNIDTCEWVGNVGWVVIALSRLQRAGIFGDPAALSMVITRGADWIAGQSAFRGMAASGFPNLISFGIEGNTSAYLGLLAAGRRSEATALGNAIFQFGWDPVQRRIKPGVGTAEAATAIDVSGSWGAMFLRTSGRVQEALDSQGYSASTMRTASFNGAVRGYGDIAGPFTPTVEFTGQAASAGISDAAFVMDEMLLIRDGNAFRGAANHWYGGSLPPWNTTMTGVAPLAWMHFGRHLDPLLALLPFTDDTLMAGVTPVRALHVTELRARIDKLRGRFDLAPYTWTDPTITTQAPQIKAVHIQDLRNALGQVYSSVAGRTPPVYTDPNLVANGILQVRAVHIAEIRAAVVAIE